MSARAKKRGNSQLEYLPARFNNAWDQTIVCHLAKAKTGKLEFFQNTAGSASELAAAAKAHRRGVRRHLVQCDLCSIALFFSFVHVENDLLETLTLVPLQLNEAFPFFLFCIPGFCHISLNLTTFYEQDLFVSACGLGPFY